MTTGSTSTLDLLGNAVRIRASGGVAFMASDCRDVLREFNRLKEGITCQKLTALGSTTCPAMLH